MNDKEETKDTAELEDLAPVQDPKGASFLGGIGRAIGGVIKSIAPVVTTPVPR